MTLNAVTPDTAPVDAAAFEWLDVPVALCDAQGALVAANAAMLRCAGLGADAYSGDWRRAHSQAPGQAGRAGGPGG